LEVAARWAAEAKMETQTELMIGKQLGSYEIVALLGRGGMGEVYRARDQKLRREVALKVLPTEFAANTERMNRFEREARMLAALNHPNIAAIYGLVAGKVLDELVESDAGWQLEKEPKLETQRIVDGRGAGGGA
jgi:hypothetical protein